MSYERFHWRLYNIMRRLVGLAAGITCLAFIWSAVSLWLHLRVPEPGESMATGYEYLMPAALTLVIGWILLRMRPYRPDEGDVSFWAGRAGGYPDSSRALRGEPRSWWTGEYRELPESPLHHKSDA